MKIIVDEIQSGKSIVDGVQTSHIIIKPILLAEGIIVTPFPVTQTLTPTPSVTMSLTPTISYTPTPTSSATPEPTHTQTPEPTHTQTPTLTASPTPTVTSTVTPSIGVSPTPTETPVVSLTPSVTSSLTPTPESTNSPTPSPTASITPTPTTTATVTPTVTSSITPSVTSTVTPTPSTTASITPTVTSTITPSVTATMTVTPTVTSTVTPTVTMSMTATPEPTQSPTPTMSPTPSAVALPELTMWASTSGVYALPMPTTNATSPVANSHTTITGFPGTENVNVIKLIPMKSKRAVYAFTNTSCHIINVDSLTVTNSYTLPVFHSSSGDNNVIDVTYNPRDNLFYYLLGWSTGSGFGTSAEADRSRLMYVTPEDPGTLVGSSHLSFGQISGVFHGSRLLNAAITTPSSTSGDSFLQYGRNNTNTGANRFMWYWSRVTSDSNVSIQRTENRSTGPSLGPYTASNRGVLASDEGFSAMPAVISRTTGTNNSTQTRWIYNMESGEFPMANSSTVNAFFYSYLNLSYTWAYGLSQVTSAILYNFNNGTGVSTALSTINTRQFSGEGNAMTRSCWVESGYPMRALALANSGHIISINTSSNAVAPSWYTLPAGTCNAACTVSVHW